MKLLKISLSAFIAVVMLISSVIISSADSIFYEDGYYYTFINNETVSLTGWDNSDSVISIPASLNGRALISISKHSFYGDSFITGLEFSKATNLKSIGMYAFAKCSALSERLILPECLTLIGDCAFEECAALNEVEINSDLSYVPIQCFNRCDSLTTVNINGQIQEIDSFAFANCPELEYVSIPDSVTAISETAFYNDPRLMIYCNSNSFAQSYAEEHNIPYILLDAVLLGDVNSDVEINISDVTTIQSYLAELITLDDKCLAAADTNQDGTVDISDATALQMYLADYNIPYPIGEYITF